MAVVGRLVQEGKEMGQVYREFRPKDIRELRGEMTQKQFAEYLGVSIYAVSSWEEGTRDGLPNGRTVYHWQCWKAREAHEEKKK